MGSSCCKSAPKATKTQLTITSPVNPQDITVTVPPATPSTSSVVVKAKYDYQQLQKDDLSFKKGDLMHIVAETGNVDWLLAKHAKTGKEGYIPSNYVVKDDNNPESQEWWFDFDRREAEKLLHMQGNHAGTFIIRKSADGSSYALSIRDVGADKHDVTIKHYRIRKTDNGGCYISTSRIFDSLVELIKHHNQTADGLCQRLTKPCPKQPELIPFKEFEVDRDAIKKIKELGSGHFGDVYSAKFRSRIDVAVKQMKPGTMSEDAFLEEAKIMHKLRHRKLVQLMGVCTKDEPMYIITELMVNGSLLLHLRSDKGRTIGVPEMTDMATQIADGMAYLEEKAYIHRDLRTANILVGENNIVKVADFGLARLTTTQLEDDQGVYAGAQDTKFPIKWTSPEAANKRVFSVKSDVWSFGVLLFEIVTFGRVPYPDMTGHEVLRQLDSGFRMPKPVVSGFSCPDGFYDTMLKCWNESPEKRPTFAFLRDFFDDFVVAAEGQYRCPDDIV